MPAVSKQPAPVRKGHAVSRTLDRRRQHASVVFSKIGHRAIRKYDGCRRRESGAAQYTLLFRRNG
jgi:hypothetical protein